MDHALINNFDLVNISLLRSCVSGGSVAALALSTQPASRGAESSWPYSAGLLLSRVVLTYVLDFDLHRLLHAVCSVGAVSLRAVSGWTGMLMYFGTAA